jgi:CRISPR-associated protein Csm2
MPNHSGPPNRGTDRGPSQGSSREEQVRSRLEAAFGPRYEDFLLNPPEERYEKYLNDIKSYVRARVRKITTHQLRNIFSRVKRARRPHDLAILRPQLAYIAGRAEHEEMRELVQLLDDLIRRVDEKTLEGFKHFYEAIIAYHKFYDIKGS